MATNAIKTPLFRAVARRGYSSQTLPVSGVICDIQTTVLPNKLIVASANNGSSLARVSIVFRAGPRYECGETIGAAHTIRIAAGLSTKNSSLFAITRNIQQNGANLICTTDRETIAYTLEGTCEAVERCSEFLSDVATQQVFKPWELSDAMPRMKLELASLPPQVKAVNFLHRVAFRHGLGNSLFCAKQKVGKLSTETLQHYVGCNFTTNRTAVVGLGVVHDQLVKYACNMTLESGAGGEDSKSKYHGGEIRSEKGGHHAYVAIGAEGASFTSQKEAIACWVLQRVMGVGPYTKFGKESSGLLAKAIAGVAKNIPMAVSGMYAPYSDTGLFGCVLSCPADRAYDIVLAAANVLKSAEVTEKDVVRAKNQLTTALLLLGESGSTYIELMGKMAVITGCVQTPGQVAEAIEAINLNDVKMAASKVAASNLSIASVGNIMCVPYLDELK